MESKLKFRLAVTAAIIYLISQFWYWIYLVIIDWGLLIPALIVTSCWLISIALLFLNAYGKVSFKSDVIFMLVLIVMISGLLLGIIRALVALTPIVLGLSGPSANFFAYSVNYQLTTGGQQTTMVGGLAYLMWPSFPLPAPAPYGVGYSVYFNQLLTGNSQLFLPSGSIISVPEWVHFLISAAAILIMIVIVAFLTRHLTKSRKAQISVPSTVESIIGGVFVAIGILVGLGVGLGMLLYMIYENGWIRSAASRLRHLLSW